MHLKFTSRVQPLLLLPCAMGEETHTAATQATIEAATSLIMPTMAKALRILQLQTRLAPVETLYLVMLLVAMLETKWELVTNPRTLYDNLAIYSHSFGLGPVCFISFSSLLR